MADQQKPDQQPLKPADQSFLTPDERSQIQRFLSYPEDFPRKFGSWIADYIAVNGLEIPASQIRGIQAFRPLIAVNGGVGGIGSTGYVDASPVGPTLSDLAAGTYLLLYGFQYASNGGNNAGYALASPSVNGATPSDSDAVRTKFMLGSDTALSDSDKTEGSCIYYKIVTFTATTNTVKIQYRVTDGLLGMTNVYLIAIKLSN